MSDTLRQEVAADLGFMMDKELRKQTVAGLGYGLGCRLIFAWVKNGTISTVEFMEILQSLTSVPPDLRKTPGNERIEFLKDVIVTAVESGATKHWATPRDYDYKKGYVEFKAHENDYDCWSVVTIEQIEQGLTYIRDPDFNIFDEYRKSILWADLADDASQLEGITADIIVQAALFNEIRYS